ncbi:hypothetical protein Naga_103002g1 [Nannochloropsis gaditana]|uniref:Uncharacterized protein n=1 Tax=Nannochloropsis gaditana TaxID=72520 RepID=W7SZN6_9STRA|nr:hypothetical protein Naga_103002g1 [Nannochloropsis gaditana]
MSPYAVTTSSTLAPHPSSPSSFPPSTTATVAEAFLASPTQWALGERLILNGRRIFVPRGTREQVEKSRDPCEVVASVLEFAFTLDASSGTEELVLLLDAVAALKHDPRPPPPA